MELGIFQMSQIQKFNLQSQLVHQLDVPIINQRNFHIQLTILSQILELIKILLIHRKTRKLHPIDSNTNGIQSGTLKKKSLMFLMLTLNSNGGFKLMPILEWNLTRIVQVLVALKRKSKAFQETISFQTLDLMKISLVQRKILPMQKKLNQKNYSNQSANFSNNNNKKLLLSKLQKKKMNRLPKKQQRLNKSKNKKKLQQLLKKPMSRQLPKLMPKQLLRKLPQKLKFLMNLFNFNLTLALPQLAHAK